MSRLIRSAAKSAVARRVALNSNLEKTCWVLEGAGFEEPDPIKLDLMENRARCAKEGRRANHKTNSIDRESR